MAEVLFEYKESYGDIKKLHKLCTKLNDGDELVLVIPNQPIKLGYPNMKKNIYQTFIFACDQLEKYSKSIGTYTVTKRFI